MADFFNEGWSLWIWVLTVLAMIGCAVLLWSQSKIKVKVGSDGKPLPVETTGHVWDETLQENNHPLPRWWSFLFYITLIFGAVYLFLFPGLGSMKGYLGWSQVGEYEEEMAAGEKQYGPLFNKYLAMDIPTVAKDPQARAIGERLFLNTCAQCHGSDAQGSKGFPNLTDKDWLYGGDPATIAKTIAEGRNGQMPSMAAAVGNDQDVQNVANYVLSLSNSPHDPIKAVLGKPKFAACAACHGSDGKGNQAIGAPNLTDNVWLYGGGLANIIETINGGRSNSMPSHKNTLSEAKRHLLTAYVWGLSNVAQGTVSQSESEQFLHNVKVAEVNSQGNAKGNARDSSTQIK
ncbi:MAG: cytochrome-c oxidase, cbb3-type subunit III [Burkholderiales bacterium]|nr:cytochrome-c oxidase, cbb3-type subunit III [Burkholderiales bacterium]